MDNKISKDYKVSLCLSIEEADMVLNALAEKVLRTENLRQFIYDSINEQVDVFTSYKEKENKKKGRKK
jgi:hypothetical protein